MWKWSCEESILRPVYTKKANYKDNYNNNNHISVHTNTQ